MIARLALLAVPRRLRFRATYYLNGWGDGESRSGEGSRLEYTKAIRAQLQAVLNQLGARSLLDVPCGDCNWISRVDLGAVRYIGADIVPEVIDANVRREARAGREFLVRDLLRDELPRADVILCRDCLVHFSFSDIAAAVANMKRSGAEYLLTTTFSRCDRNRDIVTGRWRPLNLCIPPLNWPPPIAMIDERCTQAGGAYADKALGVWRLGDLPDRNALR